jgi:glycosyltransferase involved in cell wall biosynthesis
VKVSVVTLSFNQGRFLERALCSVLEQKYDDLEYIVVDPGSTDGSRAIIERYADRLAHVVLEPDEGPADGLNRGFALATGEICAYVNADDALLPGAITSAVEAFDRDATLDVAYAHGYATDARGVPIRRLRATRFGPQRFVYGGSLVLQQSTFFRRQSLVDVAGFNPANRTCWDAELLLDLALSGKRIGRADGYWSTFTMHPQSISGSGRLEAEYHDDFERLFRKVMRRPRKRTDALAGAAARICRWATEPTAAACRIADALRPPQGTLP